MYVRCHGKGGVPVLRVDFALCGDSAATCNPAVAEKNRLHVFRATNAIFWPCLREDCPAACLSRTIRQEGQGFPCRRIRRAGIFFFLLLGWETLHQFEPEQLVV